MVEDSEETLSTAGREALLERISKRGATIGEQIPETVTIEGEEIPLREFVWETKEQGIVPPEYRDQVQTVRTKLVAERKRRKDRLDGADLTGPEAERLADSIVGIDRAITALRKLEEPDLTDQKRKSDLEKSQRWVDFLDRLR